MFKEKNKPLGCSWGIADKETYKVHWNLFLQTLFKLSWGKSTWQKTKVKIIALSFTATATFVYWTYNDLMYSPVFSKAKNNFADISWKLYFMDISSKLSYAIGIWRQLFSDPAAVLS